MIVVLDACVSKFDGNKIFFIVVSLLEKKFVNKFANLEHTIFESR